MDGPRTCPVCHDRTLIDGVCRRCALRAAAAPLIAALPAGSLAERVAAATEAVREALVAAALGATCGHRARAQEALRTERSRLAEALRRYPWIAEQWPATRTGRPAAEPPPKCPVCSRPIGACHPSCPGPEYAIPPEEQ